MKTKRATQKVDKWYWQYYLKITKQIDSSNAFLHCSSVYIDDSFFILIGVQYFILTPLLQ